MNPQKPQKRPASPPRMAQWLLSLLLSAENKDILQGDFAEEFSQRATKSDIPRARLWYWLEVLKSSPALFQLVLMNLNGGIIMGKLVALSEQNNKIAGLGLVLILPALVLCLAGISQSLLGMNQFSNSINFDLFLFSPSIILGGLFFALALNLLTVARIKFRDGDVTGTIMVRGKIANLVLLGSIGLMCAVIFLYLLAENFQVFAGI